MQLTQQPSAYTFAGNIEPIKASTAIKANFSLALFGSEILSESYDPINGVVMIKLRDLLTRHVPEALIGAGSVELPRYTFSLSNSEGVVSGSFVCVRGGHGASADAATFMRSNWLTWQPQSRTTTYHAPMRLVYASLADCSVLVKAYFADKSTAQVEYSRLTAGRLYTIDVTYGTIRGLFDNQPTAYDVWIEGGEVKSYVQRYYLAQDSSTSDVFVWRNSIGGIDTVSFCGDRIERSNPESSSALFGEVECEFDLTARKSHLKYTGYIANDNERLWVLDFFNSIGRYHIDQGAMRNIVVSKPKLEHTRGELAGYEFEFAHGDQSIYLNLPRVDTPELLEIADPSDELFFLAPRLNQLQEAQIGQGDILIPCQFANANKWLFVSIAEILSNAQGSGSGGGAPIKATAPIGLRLEDGIYTITHHLATAGVDRHGTADKFGHVTVPPHIYGGDPDIDFKARAVRANDVSSHEALASMVGYGFSMVVDPETGKSHLYIDVGHFRDGFETLEMRYRKMLVSGEELVVNNGAVVSGVMVIRSEDLVTASGTADEPIEAEPIVTQEGELIEWPLPKGVNRLRFTVKGETGIDYQMFITGDILRYTWRDKSTGLKGASGYLVVRAVVDEFTYTADVAEGSPEWLTEGMTLALFGSQTDPDRQGFIVLSSRERTISIFDGVNSTQITPDNLKVLLGNLNLVVDPTFPEIKGSGLYSPNAFLHGVFVLRSQDPEANGKSIETYIKAMNGKISLKVDEVSTVANDAIAEAKRANDKLTDWSSDAMISPVEKNALRQMHRQAIAEKEKIDYEVFRWGLTARGEYLLFVLASSNAFSAYNKYTRAIPDNITIEADYDHIAGYNTYCVKIWKLIDAQTNEKLAQTGVDIENQTITLTADKTMIRDNSGEVIAMFENGKIKANLIDVDKLVANQLFTQVSSGGAIQIGGTIPRADWVGQRMELAGIAGNPRHNSSETERNSLQADFFLGFQSVGGGILTISESGYWGKFIKVDKNGYYAFLESTKRTTISTSQIRIQSKDNSAFFDASVDARFNGGDLKLIAKNLPRKSHVSGTADIPWGALYINRNTGQIYSE